MLAHAHDTTGQPAPTPDVAPTARFELHPADAAWGPTVGPLAPTVAIRPADRDRPMLGEVLRLDRQVRQLRWAVALLAPGAAAGLALAALLVWVAVRLEVPLLLP